MGRHIEITAEGLRLELNWNDALNNCCRNMKLPGERRNRRMPQPVWLKLEDDIQQMQLQSINMRSTAAGKTGIRRVGPQSPLKRDSST